MVICVCWFYRHIVLSIICAVVRNGCYRINWNLFVNTYILDVKCEHYSSFANWCLSFFPANPRPRRASATAWEIYVCQADLTRPDPFNICPKKCEMAVATRVAEWLPWWLIPLHITYCFKLMSVHIVYKCLLILSFCQRQTPHCTST
jgi:hypothetical protein